MNPSLEQILVEWLRNTFNINAEYETRDQRISWWGWTVIVCRNPSWWKSGDARFGADLVYIQDYKPTDPDYFEKLRPAIEKRIAVIRKIDSDQAMVAMWAAGCGDH